jgi:hypothetical protein
MHDMKINKSKLPRTGDAAIDSQICILEQINGLADALFGKRITPNEYREQLTSAIASLSPTGLAMFAAVYVDSEEEAEDLYGNLEQRHGQRSS